MCIYLQLVGTEVVSALNSNSIIQNYIMPKLFDD